MPPPAKVAYLYSRYPIVSQTFCDNEMLALEAAGWDLTVGSIHPPHDSLRNANLDRLKAPILHSPPPRVIAELERLARKSGHWPQAMIDRHDREYGKSYQAATRARNALYFADRIEKLGIRHVHIHFANRATHTALFLREMTGVTLSFTTHGQDFMVDLGSDALLNEMCEASAFVVAVCDYSRELMAEKCPASADRILRVYNGLNPAEFKPKSGEHPPANSLRILSVGRLIEFKGFHHLIDAIATARRNGIDATLRIVGEGPWQEQLAHQITALGLNTAVTLLGRRDSTEVARELAQADVFALGCIVDRQGASDLLPTVITEAMLTALPVVSTTVAGVPEMIVNGETGFLVPPNDPEALAAALGKLAADPGKAHAMGLVGRRRAKDLFALDVTVPQLAKRFAEALDSETTTITVTPQPAMCAFYDLSLPGRAEWMIAELSVVTERGGKVLAAGASADKETIRTLRPILDQIEWLPDGMVLEMEWRARSEWRMRLEQFRTDLSTAVDGEVFLRAARRAVWMAAHFTKTFQHPERLYTPGVEESLTAWLVGQLIDLPLALAFESGDGWNGSLLRRMAKDADRISSASDKVKDLTDALLHGSEIARRGHIGPLRWSVPTRPPTADLRSVALSAWLDQGGTQ